MKDNIEGRKINLHICSQDLSSYLQLFIHLFICPFIHLSFYLFIYCDRNTKLHVFFTDTKYFTHHGKDQASASIYLKHILQNLMRYRTLSTAEYFPAFLLQKFPLRVCFIHKWIQISSGQSLYVFSPFYTIPFSLVVA